MKELLKKFLQKLTRENLSNTCQLGWKAFKWVMQVTEGYHWLITFSIFSGIFGVVMSLVNVAMSKWIIDVATGAQEGNIYLVATIVALSFLLGMGIKLVSPWIFGKINMRISIRMQNSLSDALMMCSWKGAGKWHTGDLLTRISSDASEVLGMGMGILPNLLVTGLQLASSFIYLWILDARLAWFILGVTPLVLLSKIYFRKVRELSCAQKKMNSEMGTVMQENLSKRILVRSLGATNYRKQKLHETQEKLFKLGMEQIKFSTFTQGVMGFTFGGGYLCAFLWGIFQLHNHEITFGTMTAFLQLVGQVQGPFLGLISIPPSLIRGWTSVERLMALFEDVEPDEHPVYIDQPLTLNFRKVSFGYEEDKEILHNISMSFPKGSFTAIVGESGSGKSTIAGILTGHNRQYRGSVTIGGISLPEIKEASLMKNVTYVSHNSYLFKGTVRDNLLMGNPQASDEELWKALEQVKLADFLRNEKGLDTELTEKASNLSGGQCQRLAFARALLHDSPVYIFDEATSNIDVESENDIMKEIYRLAAEKTVILISHRLANVVHADNIYVLEQGQLKESGTHEILLYNNSAYEQLWNVQQKLENFGKEEQD